MKDKTWGAIIGMASPHIEKILIEHSWWKDWVKPSLQSLIGAIIGVIVFYYGPKILRAFDNWRNLRKLGKIGKRENGKQK